MGPGARGHHRAPREQGFDSFFGYLDQTHAHGYYPEFQGRAVLPPQGKSLVPAFDDRPVGRAALYWEHEGNVAVRAGDWKLVRPGRGAAWELYDLGNDRAEQRDLAKERPELVKELRARWQAWAARASVTPYPPGPKQAKPKAGKR